MQDLPTPPGRAESCLLRHGNETAVSFMAYHPGSPFDDDMSWRSTDGSAVVFKVTDPFTFCARFTFVPFARFAVLASACFRLTPF